MNEGEASQCRECSTNWERSISHFDLSSLISMARMQSAQRKKARKIEKVVTPARDWTGDLLITCQMRWPLRYWDHLISIAFCAILSGSSYCITVIHEWGWSIEINISNFKGVCRCSKCMHHSSISSLPYLMTHCQCEWSEAELIRIITFWNHTLLFAPAVVSPRTTSM